MNAGEADAGIDDPPPGLLARRAGARSGSGCAVHSSSPSRSRIVSMEKLSVTEVSGPDAEAIMTGVVQKLRAANDLERLQWLREAFSCEFGHDPNQFAALSADKRMYYMVSHEGRKEALFGIKLDPARNPKKVDLCSFARIAWDHPAAEGWEYLQALIERRLLPMGATRIVALLMTKGGVKAFADLKARSDNKNYWVELIPGHPGVTALVTSDL